MTFLMMLSLLLLSMLMILLSSLSVIRIPDLLKQLELVYELESDLRENLDWDSKWLVDFNAGKIQPVV